LAARTPVDGVRASVYRWAGHAVRKFRVRRARDGRSDKGIGSNDRHLPPKVSEICR
jgi:hypothetical protein